MAIKRGKRFSVIVVGRASKEKSQTENSAHCEERERENMKGRRDAHRGKKKIPFDNCTHEQL